MKLKLYYLKKRKGGRLENVDTFTTHCNNKKKEPHLWLIPSKTIQIPNDLEDFIGVYLSKFKGSNKDIVVKIQDKDHPFTIKELKAIKKLSKMKNNNFVKYICDFDCGDNKLKYIDDKLNKFCGDGDEKIHLIIQEHINGGNISDFLKKHKLNKLQIMNIIRQLIFAMIQAFDKYTFTHNDIHSGNILISIDKSLNGNKIYKIRNKNYIVQLNDGIEPILIDYGRSTIGGKHDDFYIINDIENFIIIMSQIVYKQELRKISKKLVPRTMTLEQILNLFDKDFLH